MNNLLNLIIVFFILGLIKTTSLFGQFSKFENLNWTNLNSIVDYSILSNGKTKLNENDYCEVKFLGSIDSTGKVKRFRNDSLAFVNLTNIVFNKKKLKDWLIVNDLSFLFKTLNKEGEIFVKYNMLEKAKEFKLSNIEIYLKTNALNLEIKKLSDFLTSKFPNVVYISKDSALKIFEYENPEINWRQILNKNPLPASFKIKLSDSIVQQTNIDSFKIELLKFSIVKDVYYKSSKEVLQVYEHFKEFYRSYIFLIKPVK